MKLIKHLKVGDLIYEVSPNGIVKTYPITKITDDYYTHMRTIYFDDRRETVNMDMRGGYSDYEETIKIFSDKEDALNDLRVIAETAKTIIDNCVESMKIFS